MNKVVVGISAAIAGIGAGIFGTTMLLRVDSVDIAIEEVNEPQYWVAPMDPTYRRSEPGKSPMGMDLVPVYENNGGSGEVSISPIVENNLGVRTASVELGPLHSAIRTVGYVRFDEDRLLHLHPRVEGWIEELNVKTEGEFIRAGQAVYSIYSPTLVNAQEELVLAMDRSNQRLIQSAEERLLALQVPQSQINQLKIGKQVSQTVTVYAPQDGFLAELGIREGHFVRPGNPIMSIGVLDVVWVIAEVFERQASLVSEDDLVTMSLDYLPGRQWQGKVDFIYPTLDEKTRTVRVRLRFENLDQALKPNMFAQVVIHNDEDEAVLLVPNEAVIRTGVQDRVVLALGEGRYKSVAVTVGRRGTDRTAILSGLQQGDSIVSSAHFLLDSESSISSDFQRMDSLPLLVQGSGALNTSNNQTTVLAQTATEMRMPSEADAAIDHSEHTGMDMSASKETTNDAVWTAGKVERKMGAKMMTITHEPIPDWE
ncbi:MAG: efflux RND transporter periplasmic adaptor subunit [Gammaproteobacteria bacterium]|jgi:membrane fusion protein, copper/silver efflux system|nr:efflux RND transporter periplasmic adaptor subunit [Gammaproteobacteria bacterium]MBT5603915.1 efflux RND transporter periplasmic adaptor subunit [Gammaproteobacteria bacterium]